MIAFLVAVLLLIGNAFFVASEFALIAARRTVVEPLAEESRRARTALLAMNQIPLMIAGAQLGITLCSLGLGAIAEPALAHPLAAPFAAMGIPHGIVEPTAFVLALGIVVFFHTVLGEMVPKNLTLVGPERAALWLGAPMLAFCVATKPLLIAMKWTAKRILLIWGVESADAVKTVYTAEELGNLVAQARSEGLLGQEEHARISGALALQSRTARQVMRAWTDVTTVTEDVSPAMVEVLATRTGRSRFPMVHRETRRVIGFVHVKDVLGVAGPQRLGPMSDGLVRQLPVVGPDHTLAELLIAMRRERQHIVLVSQAGTPLGVLTLYDVLGVIAPMPPVVIKSSRDSTASTG